MHDVIGKDDDVILDEEYDDAEGDVMLIVNDGKDDIVAVADFIMPVGEMALDPECWWCVDCDS